MDPHNDIWYLLGDILLILALSGLIIPLLQRARISSVLGYLLCGLLIGPYSLGLLTDDFPLLSAIVITDTQLIHILAELGVVFLLFMIGLELTFARLWALRRLVLGLGSMQILVTTLVLVAIAVQFDNSLPISVLIGAAFALSSTAIIMQLLSEWHMMSRPTGRVCFSVLLMQDLAVVPILVLVGAFSGYAEGSVGVLLFNALITAIVVIAAIFAAGKLLLRPTLRILSPSKNAEWLFAVILFLVIGSAALTHSFGLSAALGAFLAGLLIAETEYRHEIEAIIDPVKGLLMGIFFLSVGMATDISAILEHQFWLPVSVIGIFILKAAIFYPIARAFDIPKPYAAQASVLLAQCGEFAFIVIGLALVGGLLPEQDAQFFLLVAAVSMLITPLTTRLAPFAGALFTPKENDDDGEEPADKVIPETTTEGNHVIIAGFGRVGRTLGNILEDQNIPYIAIDKDRAHVSKFHTAGYPVVIGNARYIELWQKLGIDRARAVIITIDDFTKTEHILRILRAKHPLIPIIVRVRDSFKLEKYYEAGASDVVPETLEFTLQLVRSLLENTGTTPDDAFNIIDKQRQDVLSGKNAA